MALVGNDPTNSNSHGKMANFLTSDFHPSGKSNTAYFQILLNYLKIHMTAHFKFNCEFKFSTVKHQAHITFFHI